MNQPPDEKSKQTGEALIKVLRDSPLRDVIIERPSTRSPIRRVKL